MSDSIDPKYWSEQKKIYSLLENMDGKMNAMGDGIVSLQQTVDSHSKRLDRIEEVIEDIPVIKAVVQDMNNQLKKHDIKLDDHETRITGLEHQPA